MSGVTTLRRSSYFLLQYLHYRMVTFTPLNGALKLDAKQTEWPFTCIAFMLCISYGPATSTRIFASLYAAETVKPRLGRPGQLPRLCQGICGHRVSSREFYVLPIQTWFMFLCMSRQQLVLLQHCNVPPRPVVPALYSGCGYLPDFNETIAAQWQCTVLH